VFDHVLVTLTRGRLAECLHYGAYCVVREGRVLRSRGKIEIPTFFRSSAKPFQAMTVVESGALERFGIVEEELALMCGSHDGSPLHARTAASILAKAGEKADLLRCAGHPPISREVHEAYIRDGYKPGRLEDNCSGKHSGMIAAAKALGADPAAYADPKHPVQKRNVAQVAFFCGLEERDVELGTDGCAAPNFGVPVRQMATAMGRFCAPDSLPEAKGAAARRIAKAMTAHPEYVAGPKRFDTRLMRAGGGRILSKMGAEGVQIVGVLGEGIGIAVKVADGAERAVHAVTSALLVDMGLLRREDVADWYEKPVLARDGQVVGETRVTL
jgi:L-asparaginase II